MKWRSIELGRLMTLQRGYDLPESTRQSGDVPVVTSSGITGYHSVAKHQGPGVITGRYGTIGEVHYVEDNYWPHNTTLFVKDFKGNDYRYIKYLLLSLNLAQQVSSGAVPGVNRNVLHAMKVPDIPLPIQRNIASVLSQYDYLIENNLKRIKLLGDSALQLYKEWFVRLRFLGYEHIQIVKGVPDGWEKRKIANLVKRISPGKLYDKESSYISGKVPILDQGQSGLIGYHDDEPGVIATPESPVIVFANHTCFQRIILQPFSAIQNVLPFLPSEDIPRNIFWLHYATNGQVRLSGYRGHWPEFITKEILVPHKKLSDQFGNFVKPVHTLILKLQSQINYLKQARDILLPKLLSGEVEVNV